MLFFTIANGDSIYSGGNYGGIYFSSNAGDSWIRLSDNDKYGIIYYDGKIYTQGSIKTNNKNYYYLHKSYDNGENWININGGWESKEPFILLNDSNKIYVAQIDSNYNFNIYLTTNEGIDWKLISTIKANDNMYGWGGFFVFKDIFFLLSYTLDQSDHILQLSLDMGKTWQQTKFKNGHIKQIYVSDVHDIYLLANSSVWVSSDFGETWYQNWLVNSSVSSFFISEDSQHLYAVQYSDNKRYNLLYSSNKGVSWDLVRGFNELNNYQGGISNISVNNKFVFLTLRSSGCYRTEKYLDNWQERNYGYSDLSPNYFIFNKNAIYMSCWGVFSSIDKGQTFNYLDLKSYNTGQIAINSKGDIFVGDQSTSGIGKGIFRSTDDGQSWKSLYDYQGPPAIVINKRDVLFIGSFSTDNGNTWHDPPSQIDEIGTNEYGDLFTFAWENPDNDNAGIWRSTDDGVTWNKIPAETFGFIDPTSTLHGGRVIFNNFTKSAWYGPLANSDNTFLGIYKTTDNGKTWFPINLKEKGYDWYPSRSKVAVDSLGCWVATRDGEKYGIYRSCDNGITWIREDTTGLPNEFGPIGVSPDGHIYVFGGTGGLYRSKQKYVTVDEKPKQTDELIISPNPAQDYIEIVFNNHTLKGVVGSDDRGINPSTEGIRIFDLLGLEHPGTTCHPSVEGNLRIDVSSLQPGVYFVQVGNVVRKFVKM